MIMLNSSSYPRFGIMLNSTGMAIASGSGMIICNVNNNTFTWYARNRDDQLNSSGTIYSYNVLTI